MKKFLFGIIRKIIEICYPKTHIEGLETLPDEPVIIVGNHTQMHGPIVCELFLPPNCYTWCAGQMMHLREVPAYAFADFWSQKSKYTQWFYKLLSYIIAPVSVVVFNSARTIPVYRDSRILTTFKSTVSHLKNGDSVVIFPEHDEKHNHIVYEFSIKFVDVAKIYFKQTGKRLLFVPAYIAPNLKTMYFGEGIRYCEDNTTEEERRRICDYLMQKITDIACALPEHTVVPYRNIPKKYYPSNIPPEVNTHDKI